MLLAVVLGVGAAFLFALAAVLQQRAARVATKAVARRPVPGSLTSRLPILLTVGDLVRSPLWLAGWGTNLLGFCAQAAALHLGSVALVQPVLVLQLFFTLPLVSWGSRRWPSTVDWLAGGAICGGVTVFLSVRGAAPSTGRADRAEILLATGSALLLVVVLVALSYGRRPAVRCAAISVAAGLCFALSAVFITLTATDLFDRGVTGTAADWPGYALAGSTVLGLLLEQEAFAVGALPITITAMTITNPVASYLIGILAFDVVIPGGPGALAAISASAVLLVVGTVVLARSETVRRDAALAHAASAHLTPTAR